MTYGVVMDVPAPIELYDAMHAEIRRRTPDAVDGLLLHVCRQTPEGFQIIEVWDSKESSDRANAEIVGPAIGQAAGVQPPPPEFTTETFVPRGLIVPAARIAV